jgi:hypothetical protein
MTRAKKSRRPRKRPSPRRAAPPPRPNPAETALLELARTLTELTTPETPPRAAITRMLAMLAAAFHASAPLSRALARARIAALGDKTRALALAWAREQLRLVLGEILGRAAGAGELRAGLDVEPVAWFVLAACEALADEPPQAAPDRLRVLEGWLTGAAGEG